MEGRRLREGLGLAGPANSKEGGYCYAAFCFTSLNMDHVGPGEGVAEAPSVSHSSHRTGEEREEGGGRRVAQ